MIQMTLAEVANTLNTTTTAGDVTFTGISIDTRTLKPGQLFFAISGNHLDGHAFLEQAKQNGAAAAVVSKLSPCDLPQLVVSDTTQALGLLATAWRQQFNLPIIAVTGSNGKTTLKNMIAAIMVAACNQQTDQVLMTKGNLNNHWGVPLTLLQLNHTHHYATIEMGMNHLGEIAYLTQLTRPQVAIITNAGASHLEGVGSVEGVARAKGEIFSGLNSDGVAILNRDDAFFSFWQGLIANHHYLTFGFHPAADVTAIIHDAKEVQHITLKTPEGDIDINLPLLGKHNVLNALGAAAATLATGIPLAAIKDGLEHMTPAAGRLQLHKLTEGIRIIDDTYNANPFSLHAAINILANFNGKKILVLGDMKELGEEAIPLHQTAGEEIRHAGIDLLFTYGELTQHTSQAFGSGAQHFKDQQQLVEALKPLLHNTTTILIKGSRSMRMEKVVAELIH